MNRAQRRQAGRSGGFQLDDATCARLPLVSADALRQIQGGVLKGMRSNLGDLSDEAYGNVLEFVLIPGAERELLRLREL